MNAAAVALAVIFLAAVGCGDDECGEDEVEVQAQDDNRKVIGTLCAAIPTECGAAVDCDDLECRGALYDLCIEVGVGGPAMSCLESMSPPLVECYPRSDDVAPRGATGPH